MHFITPLAALSQHCEPMLLHSIRTAIYAKTVADSMSLGKDFSKQCFEGGLMHDIGKTMVPARHLLSKRQLDKTEFMAVKMHVTFGLKILHRDTPQYIKDAISMHHERYDGRGYPNAMSGNEIPLHVRLISVVDAFDAMTSNRPHQVDIGFENAIIEIINNRGSQFCPEAVDYLVQSIHQVKIARDKMRDGTCEYLRADPICYLPQFSNISLEKVAV